MSTEDALVLESDKFAQSCTQLVRAVIGPHTEEFAASVITGSPMFSVRQPGVGIPLVTTGTEPLLYLQANFKCRMGTHWGFMKIEESSFKVFPNVESNAEPLVRYDFIDGPTPSVPSAHVQFHAEHEGLTEAMARSGSGSKRGKARSKRNSQGRVHRASELHFPVGGRRFRPSLEDVLEMLVMELGVQKQPGALTAIAASRQNWRRIQLRSAIRDDPRTAVDELRAMGYAASWSRDEAEPDVDLERLREL